MTTSRVAVAVTITWALAASACAGSRPETAKPSPRAGARSPGAKKSLYARLGGKPAIEAVVTDFVARLAGDPRIKFRFANSNVARVTADLIDFVCMASGGPCKYRGRDMRAGHASMRITEEEWDATVEALVASLNEFDVGKREKAELLGAVGSTKKDIVDPPKEMPAGQERARIDAALKDLSGFGAQAELLGAALTALRRGQRAYGEQLFSMAEVDLGTEAVADLAPLFRAGGPPRVTTPLAQLPVDTAPQPKGAIGGSEEDGNEPEPPVRASLSGQVRLPEAKKEGAFGVVMLTPVSGEYRKRTPKQRVIEQRGREFAPRLLAVPVGSTVAFPNFDDIYHNVFSRSEVRPFDLGIFKNAQSREVTFDREGIVRVGCNLHANMAASIIVVSAPHYAVTDAAGKFRFHRLRPGTYTLRAWTERSAAPVTSRIEIVAGQNQVLIDATGGAAPGPGQDKFGAPRVAGR